MIKEFWVEILIIIVMIFVVRLLLKGGETNG
jgi:hypothetical protein